MNFQRNLLKIILFLCFIPAILVAFSLVNCAQKTIFEDRFFTNVITERVTNNITNFIDKDVASLSGTRSRDINADTLFFLDINLTEEDGRNIAITIDDSSTTQEDDYSIDVMDVTVPEEDDFFTIEINLKGDFDREDETIVMNITDGENTLIYTINILEIASFRGGTGTLENPYIITSVYQLQRMSEDLTASYALGSDINAASTLEWTNEGLGKGFLPIGVTREGENVSANPFLGNFDGRGYTISFLNIVWNPSDSVPTVNAAFIHQVGDLGDDENDTHVIQNVTFRQANVENNISSETSFLIGLTVLRDENEDSLFITNVKIINSSITALNSSVSALGEFTFGVTGSVSGGNQGQVVIADCSVEDSTLIGDQVGGLVYNFGIGAWYRIDDYPLIIRSYSKNNNLIGSSSVGGLVNRLTTADIKYCYASGNVYSSPRSGGLVWSVDFANSFDFGDITNITEEEVLTIANQPIIQSCFVNDASFQNSTVGLSPFIFSGANEIRIQDVFVGSSISFSLSTLAYGGLNALNGNSSGGLNFFFHPNTRNILLLNAVNTIDIPDNHSIVGLYAYISEGNVVSGSNSEISNIYYRPPDFGSIFTTAVNLGRNTIFDINQIIDLRDGNTPGEILLDEHDFDSVVGLPHADLPSVKEYTEEQLQSPTLSDFTVNADGVITATAAGANHPANIYVGFNTNDWEFGTSSAYPLLKNMPNGFTDQR